MPPPPLALPDPSSRVIEVTEMNPPRSPVLRVGNTAARRELTAGEFSASANSRPQVSAVALAAT